MKITIHWNDHREDTVIDHADANEVRRAALRHLLQEAESMRDRHQSWSDSMGASVKDYLLALKPIERMKDEEIQRYLTTVSRLNPPLISL